MSERERSSKRPQDAVWSGCHAVYEEGQAVSASLEALRLASGSDLETLRVRCSGLAEQVRRLEDALERLREALASSQREAS